MKQLLLFVAVVSGCLCATLCYSEESDAVNKSPFAFLQGCVLGDDYVEYQRTLSRIEEQYRKGEISKDKYIELKSDAKTEYEQKP